MLVACNCASAQAARGATGRLQQSVSADVEQPGGMITVSDFMPDEMLPVMLKFDERVAAGDKTIIFRIDSFGGSVFLGLSAIQYIGDVKRAHNIRTVCIVDTKAMSMAAGFLGSDACDTRLMTSRSTLLYHNASGSGEGTKDQLLEAAEMLAALNEAMANLCAGRMNISVAEYRARIEKHAWILAVDEAVAVGAVDGVIAVADLPVAYELAPVEPSFSF